jgi:hypothetical protein
MATPLWEPGKAVYAEWLKSLTPEEKAAHLAERKVKKNMKKAWEEIKEAQQAQWLSKINSAMIAVLEKAVADGDAHALATVFDRMIGKPQDTVDVTSNGETLKAPTLIFKSEKLDDWK